MGERTIMTEAEAFALLGHLLASAEIHAFEPYDYVTMRLLDAASTVMGCMLRDETTSSHAWLEEFRREVDAKKHLRTSDPAAYQQFLREAPGALVREMKRRDLVGGGSTPAVGAIAPEGKANGDQP